MHRIGSGSWFIGATLALGGCLDSSSLAGSSGTEDPTGGTTGPCVLEGTCPGADTSTGAGGESAGVGGSSTAAGPGGGADPSGSGGSSASTGSGASGTGGGAVAPTNGYFPAASWFYQDVSSAAVASNSSTVTQWLENNGGWGTGQMRIDFSIEVLTADANTPLRTFQPTSEFYSPDCDDVPVPVPVGGALEGESGYACLNDGDCHLIVRSPADDRLYEMWRANLVGNTFEGGCLAAWDTTRIYGAQGRGDQCSSADAAGFPIAPMLINPDEVAAGEIDHAIRFILPNPRMRAGYFVHPGNHAGAPSGPSQAPVYGSRWRLRADYPVDALPSVGARVVARAMQKYGIALADGGNIALTAQSDRFTTAKWANVLAPYDLADLQPTDFDVLDTGTPQPLTYDCVRMAY